MNIRPTQLEGLAVVERVLHCDSRGSFARLFCARELHPLLGDRRIVQINQSVTRAAGAIRGMHFQHVPHAEMKLVRCVRGRVWDVAVDLRKDSATFLRWYARELSEDNGLMMVIPEGFAHGFQALEPDCELLYLHTCAHCPDAEGGVRFDDPRLGISWPCPPTDISARDRSHRPIEPDFFGIDL